MNCKTILVVEDDNDIRESIKDFLEFENYSVMTAANGKEALAILDKNKPCLVLLDLLMPIMGGREFLDIIKEDVFLAPIPVFIVSSIASPENSKGAEGFIKKPADLEVVLRMVKSHCS